jgi:hypothetical protein
MKVKIYILFALAIFACVIQTIGQTIYEQSNNEMKYWKLTPWFVSSQTNPYFTHDQNSGIRT